MNPIAYRIASILWRLQSIAVLRLGWRWALLIRADVHAIRRCVAAGEGLPPALARDLLDDRDRLAALITPRHRAMFVLKLCAATGAGIGLGLWLLLGVFGLLIRWFPWGGPG